MREEIDCPSCGNRVERGGSCEVCIEGAEESQRQIEDLRAQLAEAQAECERLKSDHKAFHDTSVENEASLRKAWQTELSKREELERGVHSWKREEEDWNNEMAKLRQQLQASQAREAVLREALTRARDYIDGTRHPESLPSTYVTIVEALAQASPKAEALLKRLAQLEEMLVDRIADNAARARGQQFLKHFVDAERAALMDQIAKLQRGLKDVLRYCRNGDPCPGIAHCNLYEHAAAWRALYGSFGKGPAERKENT